MSEIQLKAFRNDIGTLLDWKGSKAAKEKAITNLLEHYSRFQAILFEQTHKDVYDLSDLTRDIFRLAKKEVEENNEKWEKEGASKEGKENRKDKKDLRTRLYELSIKHIKRCCKTEIDQQMVPWIPYCLAVLQFPWVQSDTAMEYEISNSLVLCSNASKLHLAKHFHLKSLWEFIWIRGSVSTIDPKIFRNYMSLAENILDNVDFSIFVKSPIDLVQTVISTIKKSSMEFEDQDKFWINTRMYSSVHILSNIVHRWGLEARDFILREIFELIHHLLPIISPENKVAQESKTCMMKLVDDVIKLSMIETVKSHRTIDQETEEKVKKLIKIGICQSLRSAHRTFSNRTECSISDEYVQYLARWFFAERSLVPPVSMDESMDSEEGASTKKKESIEFTFEGLIQLSFGSSIAGNRCNAWNGAMQIINELLKSPQLELPLKEKIITILWKKRKSYASDELKTTFCSVLSTVIPQNLRFGHRDIPTIDAILNHSFSLMFVQNTISLPNAAFLTETILRHRASQVPKEVIRSIWNTVSRISPNSIEVLRVISALISFTEFDENSRFANNENVGSWSLRKDVIEWLLADPSANCHKLIYELCQHHPMFCYDIEQTSLVADNQLLKTLKLCKLITSPENPPKKDEVRPLDATIQEIVHYVHDKLKCLLASEIALPTFILCYEFFLKFPDISFGLDRIYRQLSDIMNDLDDDEFLQSIKHFSEWPSKLELPIKKHETHCLIPYFHTNLENQCLDLRQWTDQRKDIVEQLAEDAKNSPKIREKMQKSIPFNEFVREHVVRKLYDDVYEAVERFDKFSFLLSRRNSMVTMDAIMQEAIHSMEDEGATLNETDVLIVEKLLTSTCIRNGAKQFGGYQFDPYTVAVYAKNVFFDDRSVKIYLELLKKSPFLAQNIVRCLLEKSEVLWHLHVTALKIVMRNKKLLAVCIATIPNMICYLKIYQVHFDLKSSSAQFLKFDSNSIIPCQNYLRKPKENASSITSDKIITLFGCEKNKWKRVIYRFWKLFEREPASICEKLHEFAKKCVDLGLKHRLVSLLKALATSEFCKKVFSNRNLKMMFKLTYRSIFLIVVKDECSSEIVEMCIDLSLRYDLFKHRIKIVPPHHLRDFENFETKIAFAVENFLKTGIESDRIDHTDFGLVEFYKQLNENLTEDAIKGNELRNIYIVDFLTTIWLQLPSLRPQILPIVARFKHISPAWTNFPQPSHYPADEKTFIWRLRFNLTMKLINVSTWKLGEYATWIMLILTSYDANYYKSGIIDGEQMEKLKLQTKRNVLCVLCKILKKETMKENEEEDAIDETLFEALTRYAGIFPDIAACVLPFLFKICVDFKSKDDIAMRNLFECLKGVDKENQQMVYCLAECVDSIGLSVIAHYERFDIDDHPLIAPHWYFVLARLFLRHGYLTHAFAIANLLFDRLSSKKRNTMMIDRISLEGIEKSEQIIELLVEIYVAENNSTALSSLPPGIQNRPEVRYVMHKNSKEWLKLVSSDQLDANEFTIIQWMCGLPSNFRVDKYLDSILRCGFKEYPKILDSSLKFVYFQLFHRAIGTEIPLEIDDVVKNMSKTPTIHEMRLMMIANKTENFEPKSIEEHVILGIRYLRETQHRRQNGEFKYGKEINDITSRKVKLTEMLTENNAHHAATLLLKAWEEECLQWNHPSIDIDLIRICKEYVTCQSGDPRTSEINLRSMQPRVSVMSDVAICEWALALSKITIEYRNDVEEGIRILELGCRHLQNKASVDARLKVLLKFHSVCIGQLSKLEEYRETRTYRMKQEAISVFEQQLQHSTRLTRGNSGDKTVHRVKREIIHEKNDVEKVENSVLSAARKAVSSAFDALSCISQLDDDQEAIRASSLIVFPLIDVIYKYEQDSGVVALLKEHAKRHLPSKLWLCATSHIASKCFSIEKSPITRHLSQILCHLVHHYPYHVLHTILMYEYEKNGSEVKGFLNAIFNAKTSHDVSKLKEIVYAMREAHAAYREIACLNVKEDPRIKRVQIDGKTMLRWPSDLKIFKCKLNQLPIPTISQKIGRPGDLSTSGLITWTQYKDVFTIADGLSAPKIWEIEGSDGKWYKTVWKKDDVRQDVLVEQMFDVTNMMLEKRILRTYNVVPLDTECGIIEFCGGTVSLKELLCGVSRSEGLHQEFNSDEPAASKVSTMMRSVQTESTETRRKVFVDICQQYSPVFRHFFYTHFPTAHIWREKIINYRQSLATWSVVCYIVGLGDRHASNILFDQKECTFVHIDLGMILEYSKRTLPVPEQVPFRMSRDVLDPILIEGIENGQLAEDCTIIMEKLKENGKVILGVASALLRETMTNFREADQTPGRPSYISEMAIGRLRDKLRGTDDGVTAQSTNLQIRRLLREATNADNLSRMFCGWMPFL